MQKANYNKSLQEKTDAQLDKELAKLQQELAEARLKKAVNKLSNTSLIKKLTDQIARVYTEITNRNKK